jgi:thiamine pyrophosphate-dependent acetolactate synthase large subunit-like protein
MRRSTVDFLTIKVKPDDERPTSEVESIQAFADTIKDFEELPMIMDRAMAVMAIGTSGSQLGAFARDVLSVEIEGPSRPQLTFVDLPGLIRNETKEVTKADVELVQEIADRSISKLHTIILTVVSATNDTLIRYPYQG